MDWAKYTPQIELEAGFQMARVVSEHRERYEVFCEEGFYQAEVTGHLRFTAEGREAFPVVGDWVKVSILDDQLAIIHKVLPRKSVLKRQSVGQFGEVQLIAANIDVAFIVQAAAHDFNLNRLDRYLTICFDANILPIVIITKTDLVSEEERSTLEQKIRTRHRDLQCLSLSIFDPETLSTLEDLCEPHRTYCFLGSSGVGKSTLINHLLKQDVQLTHSISESTAKGKHTTTSRKLIQLENESMVIDTPGMRELGMADQQSGLQQTFGIFAELATECLFRDCSHTNEKGCAILLALQQGTIDQDSLDSYHKLQREQERFTTSKAEKRRKSKAQGKLYKAIQSEKRKRKY